MIKEGWLVHFTNKDRMVRRHFWRLDTKSIVLFQNDHTSKYYKEIPLSEILTIDSARSKQAGTLVLVFGIFLNSELHDIFEPVGNEYYGLFL